MPPLPPAVPSPRYKTVLPLAQPPSHLLRRVDPPVVVLTQAETVQALLLLRSVIALLMSTYAPPERLTALPVCPPRDDGRAAGQHAVHAGAAGAFVNDGAAGDVVEGVVGDRRGGREPEDARVIVVLPGVGGRAGEVQRVNADLLEAPLPSIGT